MTLKETTGVVESQTGEQTALLLQPNPPTAGRWEQWGFYVSHDVRTWYVDKIFFLISRLMTYTDVRLFSLSSVLFPRE